MNNNNLRLIKNRNFTWLASLATSDTGSCFVVRSNAIVNDIETEFLKETNTWTCDEISENLFSWCAVDPGAEHQDHIQAWSFSLESPSWPVVWTWCVNPCLRGTRGVAVHKMNYFAFEGDFLKFWNVPERCVLHIIKVTMASISDCLCQWRTKWWISWALPEGEVNEYDRLDKRMRVGPGWTATYLQPLYSLNPTIQASILSYIWIHLIGFDKIWRSRSSGILDLRSSFDAMLLFMSDGK